MAKAITVLHVPICMAIKHSATAIVAPCWTQGNVEGTGSSHLLVRNASSEVFQLADCQLMNLSHLREDFLSL